MTDTTDTGSNVVRHRSLWGDVWRQFRAHRGALFGVSVFAAIILAVTFGPFLYDVDPQFLDIRNKNLGPSLSHPMGTDNLGRDTLAQVLHGGRVSLAVGITAMLLSLLLGTGIGLLAGYFRRLDGPLMRLTDLFLALPLLPLLLVIILLFRDVLRAVVGPEAGIFLLIVAIIGATSLDADRAHCAGRCAEPAGARIRTGRAQYRCVLGADHPPPYHPQCAEPDHGLGHPRGGQRHHHRERAELSWTGLSVGFSDLGTAAVRWRQFHDPDTVAGDLAGVGDLADRAERELYR